MTNPIIIFAKSRDYEGAWDAIERCAIAHDGKVLDPNSMDAAVIVLKDETLPDQLALEFEQESPVFGVEHAGRKPSVGQRAIMDNWPNYLCVASFNHVSGTYFYESLKVLLGSHSTDSMRKGVVADLMNRCSADAAWLALNEFAMVQQIKLLDPQADTLAFETAIKALESGADLFKRINRRVPTARIINDEIERLSAGSAG